LPRARISFHSQQVSRDRKWALAKSQTRYTSVQGYNAVADNTGLSSFV